MDKSLSGREGKLWGYYRRPFRISGSYGFKRYVLLVLYKRAAALRFGRSYHVIMHMSADLRLGF